ncbi:glycosyltransferase family 92 protein [Maridesulfovibrio sp.]|uniref:glycosyltransferase family 92 protein n=1 Tax=Maridesulfovibrio sp. TaxID=2795000 RepID=UPI0029F54050|nr:glycosyltransferase family 92 protein [Maridesulfovibrio sp.]
MFVFDRFLPSKYFCKNLLEYIKVNVRRYPGSLLFTNFKAGKLREKYNFSDSRVDLPRRVEVGAVAIMRAEDKFITEWICYHKLMGVDHFYLYDNGDVEESKRLLAPFIDEGSVTLIPFPDLEGLNYDRKEKNKYKCIQYLAYGDFLVRYAHNMDWVIKVDIDEFVYPRKGSGFRTIKEYLVSLENISGLKVPSRYFGDSGHDEAPDDIVIASYDKRVAEPMSYKTIARTDCILPAKYSTAHDFNYRLSCKKFKQDEEVLALNHYYTKSKEDYVDKIEKFKKGYQNGYKKMEQFKKFNSKTMIKDEGDILEYVDGTKELMDQYKA